MTEEQLQRLNKVKYQADNIETFLDYVGKNMGTKRTYLEAIKNKLKSAHWAYGALSAQYALEPDEEEAMCNYLMDKLTRLRKELSDFGQ